MPLLNLPPFAGPEYRGEDYTGPELLDTVGRPVAPVGYGAMRVQVLAADGTVLHQVIVDPNDVGTNFLEAVEAGYIEDVPAARALAVAAPHVCPHDCDGCRS